MVASVSSNDKKSSSNSQDTDDTDGEDNTTPDTTAPTLQITSDAPGIVNSTTGNVTLTFTFDEAVSGFSVDDITLSGGTAGAFSAVSDTVYTLVVTADNNSVAPLTVDVGANAASDEAGNGNEAAAQLALNVDTVLPTAIINVTTTVDNVLTLGETAQVTITFSEEVTNFTLADLTAENATLSGLATVDNIVWTATLTPDATTTDNTNVVTLADTYNDASGNPGTPAVSGNYDIDTNSAIVVFDLIDDFTSTNIGGRSFDAGINYAIYLLVDSNNGAISLNGADRWTNGGNLDLGDTITLVGNGGPIIGSGGSGISNTLGSAGDFRWLTSSGGTAARLFAGGAFTRFRTPTGTEQLWTGANPTFTVAIVVNNIDSLPATIIDP